MELTQSFEEWLISEDCYGNRMVADEERSFIIKRFEEVKDALSIVEGDLEKDHPGTILIDITHHAPDLHPGKNVWINLAHYIRPCSCEECNHECQYECYISNCKCCDECT